MGENGAWKKNGRNLLGWTLTAFNWDSYGITDRIDWTTLGHMENWWT